MDSLISIKPIAHQAREYRSGMMVSSSGGLDGHGNADDQSAASSAAIWIPRCSNRQALPPRRQPPCLQRADRAEDGQSRLAGAPRRQIRDHSQRFAGAGAGADTAQVGLKQRLARASSESALIVAMI
jgi:hypothetical protein